MCGGGRRRYGKRESLDGVHQAGSSERVTSYFGMYILSSSFQGALMTRWVVREICRCVCMISSVATTPPNSFPSKKTHCSSTASRHVAAGTLRPLTRATFSAESPAFPL